MKCPDCIGTGKQFVCAKDCDESGYDGPPCEECGGTGQVAGRHSRKHSDAFIEVTKKVIEASFKALLLSHALSGGSCDEQIIEIELTNLVKATRGPEEMWRRVLERCTEIMS